MATKFNDAFWRWFGDSKVVDSDGNPLVVYHGTNKKFKVFKTPAYFTTYASEAEDYALEQDTDGWIFSAYLSIQNPIIYRGERFSEDVSFKPYDKKHLRSLKNKGYDGIHWIDTGYGHDYWIAFYPEQIKSA